MIPAWWLAAGVASAADGELEALVGARTAPDAALEQPSEWEPEVEPTFLTALVARVRSSRGEAWWGIEGSAWGTAPEPDASLFGVVPRAGIGASSGPARLELAARYDAQLYPWAPDATNGRAEGLLKGSVRAGSLEPQVTVEAIDRHYPFETVWSFRTVEPGLGLGFRSTDQRFRGRLAGSWQLNQGASEEGRAVTGAQLRGTADLGWSARRWEAWTTYRIIRAMGGGVADPASRALFTPIGDYSADADALSAGGFWQHRLELGASAAVGEWTVRTSALGRLRESETQGEPLRSYGRTLHGQVDLERELGDRTRGLVTVGGSGVRLDDGKAFTDIYAWVGLSWTLSGPDDASDP